MGLREGSFGRMVVRHAASEQSENRKTGAGSDRPCLRRTGSSRDRQSTGKVVLRPRVLKPCSDLDRRSDDTCQPTGAALDNLKGRETFYIHSVLCLGSLASDLLVLTSF